MFPIPSSAFFNTFLVVYQVFHDCLVCYGLFFSVAFVWSLFICVFIPLCVFCHDIFFFLPFAVAYQLFFSFCLVFSEKGASGQFCVLCCSGGLWFLSVRYERTFSSCIYVVHRFVSPCLPNLSPLLLSSVLVFCVSPVFCICCEALLA